VIGYGMAAARLAEGIRRHDPEGQRVALTVLAAEPHAAYNRVLLSSVVGGRLAAEDVRLHVDGWEEAHAVRLTHGAAVAIDRERRAVRCADGTAIGYGTLVLATGSRPDVPALAGVRRPDGGLAPGVTCFRTLDDCRAIVAAATAGRPVIVLGGGLLGVEAARGLAARGTAVTLVHRPGHLMERQLDRGAARPLARWLRGLGIRVLLGAHAARWAPGQGLHLADGTVVPGATLVVTAGVRAETGLAAAAGLRTDRGVLVDDWLRTSDPRIHAIGDCAQHPGVRAGLVQSAWDQADVLAGLLTGHGPAGRYRGTSAVTRLKAHGIDLTSVGDPLTDEEGAGDPLVPEEEDDLMETLRFDDPARGRYARLTLRRDRIAGAVMLGLPDAAAAVVQLVDSGTPAPSDRLALLLGRALPGPAAGGAAAGLPAGAIVCRCNSVTKGALTAAWKRGARTMPSLAEATRATTGCGGCADAVTGLAAWLHGQADAGPLASEPAASRTEEAVA
jgi:assimilatory nitrate reductase electron transfer subunit